MYSPTVAFLAVNLILLNPQLDLLLATELCNGSPNEGAIAQVRRCNKWSSLISVYKNVRMVTHCFTVFEKLPSQN